jgi:hypothetical protein
VDLGSDLGSCDSEAGPASRGVSGNSVAFGGCAGFLDSESRSTKCGTGVQDVDRSCHAKSGYYRMLPGFVIVCDAVGRARCSGLMEYQGVTDNRCRGTDVAQCNCFLFCYGEVFQIRHFDKEFALNSYSGQ